MLQHTYLVVMAGGIGSRFWPYSRVSHPKQFHDILGTGRSMLQATVDRFEGICPLKNVFVVTNRDYRALVEQHLPGVPTDQILGEPIGRNTAPCIAYASYRIAQIDPQALVIVTPADHAVLLKEEFQRVIRQALTAAHDHDMLLTLGITPARPDTGYGYIQYTEEGPADNQALKKVKTFTEKPNQQLAEAFLSSGDFLWNSGLFIWRVRAILQAFDRYLPDVGEIFGEAAAQLNTPTEAAAIAVAYSQCRNISIDYGVMEKADNVYVLPADFGWSDLGTWDSLHRVGQQDDDANVVDGNTLLYDTSSCIIKTPSERLVVVQGLEGYIVAEHDNVLLICKRSEEQRVKEFVVDAKNKMGSDYN